MDEKDFQRIEDMMQRQIQCQAQIFSNDMHRFKVEIKEDFRHQMGIQCEYFQHKLDLVVEGHQLLYDKIDGLDLRMDKLDGRMDKLDLRMDKLDDRMDKLDLRMDKLDGRMDKLDGRMDKLDGRMDRLDGRMDRQETRMISVEDKIDTIGANIKAHRNDTEMHH